MWPCLYIICSAIASTCNLRMISSPSSKGWCPQLVPMGALRSLRVASWHKWPFEVKHPQSCTVLIQGSTDHAIAQMKDWLFRTLSGGWMRCCLSTMARPWLTAYTSSYRGVLCLPQALVLFDNPKHKLPHFPWHFRTPSRMAWELCRTAWKTRCGKLGGSVTSSGTADPWTQALCHKHGGGACGATALFHVFQRSF